MQIYENIVFIFASIMFLIVIITIYFLYRIIKLKQPLKDERKSWIKTILDIFFAGW